jgi:hypothetical protein
MINVIGNIYRTKTAAIISPKANRLINSRSPKNVFGLRCVGFIFYVLAFSDGKVAHHGFFVSGVFVGNECRFTVSNRIGITRRIVSYEHFL